MAKTPSPLTAQKIKKLAAKALKSPSMLTTEETRELGGSVLAHIEPRGVPAKKTAANKKASGKG
jgi:hypothetical protein